MEEFDPAVDVNKQRRRSPIGQTFAKLFNTVFSRFNVTIFLVLLQAGYFALLLFRLDNYAGWIGGTIRVIGLFASLFIIWRNYNPMYKISWIFFIGVLPALGTASYLFFGNKKPSRRLRKKLAPQDEAHIPDLRQEDDLSKVLDERTQGTCSYIEKFGPYPAWTDTKTKYYPLGDDMFPDLLLDLQNAKDFIFIEFFIIGEGYMWRSVEQILMDKAREGVDVRVIYDDVGSIKVLPKGFNKYMEEAGIKVITFNPVHPILSLAYNNRDHRKILVIDGNIGYTGGVNLADEYINRIKRFGHWKDTAIRLEGKAVWNFTVMFLNMWNAFRTTDLTYDRFKPDEDLSVAEEDDTFDYPDDAPSMYHGIVQPYGDTPLDEEHVGEFVYMEIVNQAKNYLYIYTPYLLIDSEMQIALELAVKRGVKVTIVTPHIPDKKMVFLVTRSNYEPLLSAGVRIMEYTPGFVHSKVFVADDRMAVVGTVNMDFRSFFFHFENATLLIDCPCIKDIRRDFEETFEKCTNVTQTFLNKRLVGRVIGAFLRVLSPLM